MTEYYNLVVEDDGNQYLVIQTFVADPRYLTGHFVRTLQFKREPTAASATPCRAPRPSVGGAARDGARRRPARGAAGRPSAAQFPHRPQRRKARRADLERRAPRAHRRPFRPHRGPRVGARRRRRIPAVQRSDLERHLSMGARRAAQRVPRSRRLQRHRAHEGGLPDAARPHGRAADRAERALPRQGRPPPLSRRQRPHRHAARARRHAHRRRGPLRRPALQRAERSRRALERLDLSHGQRVGHPRRPRESRFAARLQRSVPDSRQRDDAALQQRRQSRAAGRTASRCRPTNAICT